MSTSLDPRTYTRHTRQNPCPECGKPKGCITFRDGMTLCLHKPSERQTESGWNIHWPNGERPVDWRDRIATLPPSTPAPEIDPDLADRANRALLRLCPPSDAHRADLHRRGFTDAAIARRLYGTWPADPREQARTAAAVVAEVGEQVIGAAPGFYRERGRPAFACYAGMLQPAIQRNQVLRLKVRPDDPQAQIDGKYRWVSSAGRQDGIGCPAVAHVALPAEWIPGGRVGITEAIYKADMVAERLGMPCIAVASVGSTRGLAELLSELQASDVAMLYDMDRLTNEDVTRDEQRVFDHVAGGGITTLRGSWPSTYKGIDDALAAGIVPVLQAAAPPIDPSTKACPDLRRRYQELQELHSSVMAVLGNAALNPAERIVAVMLLKNQAVSAERNTPATESFIPNIRIAEDAGLSEGTAAAAIKTIESKLVLPSADDASEPEPVDLFDRTVKWSRVDQRTGELRDRKQTFYAPKFDRLSDGLRMIARAEKVEKRAHGGKRTVCPDHPDAGVLVKWTKVCAHPGCDRVLDQGETRQSPRQAIEAEPTLIDGTPPANDAAVNRQDAGLVPDTSPPDTSYRTATLPTSHNRAVDPDMERALRVWDDFSGSAAPVAPAQAALSSADHAPPDDRHARMELAERLTDVALVRGRRPDPKPPRTSPPTLLPAFDSVPF